MKEGNQDAAAFDALYRIVSRVGQTEDSAEALEVILDEIVKAFDAATASISLVDRDARCLRIEAARGLPQECLSLQLPFGVGVTGWVALHGEPLLLEDVEKDNRYFAVKDTIRSELAVPMEEAGQVIGVVSVDSESAGFFTEADQKLLTILASEASRAVSRIWHIQQLKTKAAQLQTLANAGQKLASRMETNTVIEGIVEEACNISHCQMATLLVFDPEAKVLRLRFAMDRHGRLELEETLDLRESSVGAAVVGRRQVEVYNLRKTEEHHLVHYTQEAGLASMLVTPLLHGHEIIGVLNVYTRKLHRFSNEERGIFQTLARMGAISIQNARFYRRIFDTEATLRQSEKMNTLGLLAAEIAHEIRNPLTVIKLLFDPLENALDEGAQFTEDLRVIRDRLDQLEEIVSRVLDFGRAGQAVHAEINFDHLMDDTYRLLRLKLEQSRVQWSFEPHVQDSVIHANRGQLQQVLLNLSLNALAAMPEGGEIRIVTETLEQSGGLQFCVTFTDSGQGIPEDLQGQVFESFLSRGSQGTGLGLSIIKRILREHRGDIKLVSSMPGETVIRFWLPVEQGN